MKKIFLILLFLSTNIFAQTTTLVASPIEPGFSSEFRVSPISNQDFYLWDRHSGCSTDNYEIEPQIHVDIIGSEISVFFKPGQGGSTVCASPPPPVFIKLAAISGVDAGTYNLSTYFIPFADDFPPAIIDYPNYYSESIQFTVVQGTSGAVNVDATTNIGLGLLVLLMLSTRLYFRKIKD